MSSYNWLGAMGVNLPQIFGNLGGITTTTSATGGLLSPLAQQNVYGQWVSKIQFATNDGVAPAPAKPKSLPNLKWLDERVDEMRVALP